MEAIKKIGVVLLSVILFNGCINDFLNYLPQDKITSAIFPETEAEVKMLLNGVYTQLRDVEIYNQGLFGFGILDGATPNAYNWGNTTIAKIGNGTLSTGDGEMLTYRWTRSYSIISRANYLISCLEKLNLPDNVKKTYVGEAHFLRGLAYATLVESYGGVPIIDLSMTAEQARTVSRTTAEATWNQAVSDYDIAIANLREEAPEAGRATKGAALGMKMRAYLYQGKYQQVLKVVDQIDSLGKYALFPSYEGLFLAANENNEEVLFDIQYIRGENSQGSYIDQYCGTGTGSWTRGSRYVPTDDLVNAYETIDGSPVDETNPYDNRDSRLAFTIVLPGSYFLGYQFPNYLYPGGAFNHAGNPLKHLSTRKYRVPVEADLPPAGQSYINYIVLRYADVILAKAEAIIETGGNVAEAITLINKIRNDRTDVKFRLYHSHFRVKKHEKNSDMNVGLSLLWKDYIGWISGDGVLAKIFIRFKSKTITGK